MKYYLGIDGGGTKTAYLLVDENGKHMAKVRTEGCSYKEIGIEGAAELLKKGTEECISMAGIEKKEIAAAALGLPCYGEMKEEDVIVEQAVKAALSDIPLYIANDVEVGWAGSLGLQPGINVVAGTGSIAYGKNREGKSARSGGWSSFFSDEGSCYWLGRRTMELFAKQSDGRAKKDELYHIIRKEFELKEDFDFIKLVEEDYIHDRSKVASLQMFLLRAARQGDTSASKLYEEAVMELGAMVLGVAGQLWQEEEIPVSYSGGLFHAGELVIPLLKERVKEAGGYLVDPLFSPVQGAVLLAMQSDCGQVPKEIIEKWKK